MAPPDFALKSAKPREKRNVLSGRSRWPKCSILLGIIAFLGNSAGNIRYRQCRYNCKINVINWLCDASPQW